jgi:alanine dehydrogenase
MGAVTVLLDRSLARMRYLDDVFGRDFKMYASAGNTIEMVRETDGSLGGPDRCAALN